MRHHEPGESWSPEAADLAAYVDGELHGNRREQVDAWLAHHPDAAAELRAHRRLAQVWQASSPPEPSLEQWRAVLERVASTTPVRRSPRPVRWQRFYGIAIAVAGTAAAVVLALSLDHADPQGREPLVVVTPEDVEIVSVSAADRMTLVVGVPPLQGPLELVSPGDIESLSVRPDSDGMLPHVPTDAGPAAPMIVAPLNEEAFPEG